MARVQGSYLFSEIAARRRQFVQDHPGVQLISLGIGDTTEPLSPSVAEALVKSSHRLGTPQGYVGYGPEQGIDLLREKIAEVIYKGQFSPREVFVSDGVCCDIARLQVLFGSGVRIAVQDPSYPAYIDGSLLNGVREIHLMPCLIENSFFPNVHKLPPVDLIYFCSPNNPTGVAASHAQLKELVAFAQDRRSIIIFDRAYSSFISDPSLPKSIYEVEGAEAVAIEIGSFSKSAGFTGVRLGWSVVPEALKYSCGRSVRSDWDRIVTTLFNGASIIAQHGGMAALVDKESSGAIKLYLENARLIKSALEAMGYEVFGGTQAPYLWVRFPGKASWDVFQELLEKAHIITVPGSGFGPSGEGFIRFSAYGKRENILCAIDRLKSL